LRVTQSLPEGARTIIEALQPYHREIGYQHDPLWQLDKLWNIDKHRVIPVQGIVMHLKAPRAAHAQLLTFYDHAEMRMPIAFKEQMQSAPMPTAEIVFGSEIDGLTVAAPNLADIYNYVTGTVLPKFRDFFSQSR
jgi:hypothetical protein